MKKDRSIQFVISMVIALVCGLGASGVLALYSQQAFAFAYISTFAPLLIAFLYGFGGMIPAALMALSMLTGGYFFGGFIWMSGLLITAILPGAAMIYCAQKPFKFFTQVRNAILIQALCYISVVVIVYVVSGKDMATLFGDVLGETLNALSDEGKEMFAQFLYQNLRMEALPDAMKTTDGLISTLLDEMKSIIELAFPATLALLSFINGAVGVLWMNWLRARHGEERVEFVPLSGWRLSKQITLGLLIILAAVVIIRMNIGEGAVSAEIMVLSAVTCAAFVQFGASLLSRLKMAGVTVGKRTGIFFAVLILLMEFVIYYGIASALFGSQGLFRSKNRKKPDGQQFDNHEGV